MTVTLDGAPLGTGNDVARTLGVPLNFEEAARVALDGRCRAVDLIAKGEGAKVLALIQGMNEGIYL